MTSDQKYYLKNRDRIRAKYKERRAEAQAYRRAYYAANREKALESTRRWRRENREAMLAAMRAKRLANLEEARAYHRAWQAAHREQAIARSRKYHAEHREEQRAYGRKRRLEKGPEINARQRERRALNPNARVQGLHFAHLRRQRELAHPSDLPLTAKDVRRILAARTFCPLCGKKMLANGPRWGPRAKHLDHIVPINQGGAHTEGNVRVVCARCNESRPVDGSDYRGQMDLFAKAS